MNPWILKLLVLLLACIPLSDAGGRQLPESLQRILDIRRVPHDSVSIHVRDVDSGEVVLRWEDDVQRNPASTMKLVTTLVGLDMLGPTYRWKTEIHARLERSRPGASKAIF